jgi:G2/mitotic-specific cyclin 1/2
MKSSVYIRQWALNRWPESADGTSEFQGEELVAEIEGRLEPVMEVRDY